MRPHVVLLNGSLRGLDGNTGWLLEEARRRLGDRADVTHLVLADPLPEVDQLVQLLQQADVLVAGTGLYWDAWGSPMQRFLEVITPWENTDAFFGKPVGAFITADSVGGSDLSARLLSVFNQFGCVVPPCASLVLTRVGMRLDEELSEEDDDVWQIEDLDVVMHNLLEASRYGHRRWRAWPFRPLTAPRGAFPAAGRLDLGSPRFLPRV